MAIDYDWSDSQRLVTSYHDHLGGRELITVSIEQSGDPRMDDVRQILSDFQKVGEVDISFKEMLELASCMGVVAKTIRNVDHALVLRKNKTKHLYLAKLYQFMMKKTSWSTHIFMTIDEAQDWLDQRRPSNPSNASGSKSG